MGVTARQQPTKSRGSRDDERLSMHKSICLEMSRRVKGKLLEVYTYSVAHCKPLGARVKPM